MHAITQTYPIESRFREWLAATTFTVVLICAWILWHGYIGIWHDGQLYTFQALAHLHPTLLANDLFLRFGSQDDYTVFSPLYAGAIRLLGIEHAAAFLTLLFQAAFVASAWVLARKLLPARLVWLAVALVIGTRGDYGTYRVFTFMEDFITPRMAAEAWVLAGLTAMLSGRRVWTALCMIAAVLLHPLMGIAGVAFIFCLHVAIPRPKLATALCALAACVLIALALSPLSASLRFDDQWLELVRRKGYLFVTQWGARDWGRVAISATTLLVGALTLAPSPARSFCGAGLLLWALGIGFTLLGVDMLHLAVIAQAQPWRCLWITSVIAVLVLPLVIQTCWRMGEMGRAAALLLIGVWLLRGYVYPLEVAPLSVAAALAAAKKTSPPEGARRWVNGGAWTVAILSAVWAIANLWLLAKRYPLELRVPGLVLLTRVWGAEGVLSALVLAGAWYACWKAKSPLGLYACAIVASVICILVMPIAATERTHVTVTPELFRAYEPWRQLIPAGQEVFWAKGDPYPAWVLLQRPSYMTNQQTGTNLFSRRAGMELERRSEVLRRAFNLDQDSADVAPTLATVCAKSDLKFLVTSYDLRAPALAEAPAGIPDDLRTLRLYRCDR